MIRILHVIDTGGPGGAETVFLQTVTSLDSARFRSVPVVGGDGWLAEQLRLRSFPPYIAPAKGSFNLRYLFRLASVALRERPNVILAHLYGSAVYAGILGRLLSIPVISVLHGQTDVSDAERFSSLKIAIIRSGSRKVIFVSQRLRDHLRPRLRLPLERSAVIPNGADTRIFKPAPDRSLRAELGLSDDTALIGAVGNIRAPKGYEVLLSAARKLMDRLLRFHLAIAGDCTNALGEQLQQLSRELGIEGRVTFLGLRSDVSRILNNLDVFVLSSHTEGFSIACIEAMACGIPIVATRSGGPEEILEGDAGILVPTGDPESLASAIEQVISSKKLAATMIAKGIERVQQRYSLTTMLSRYEELLEQVAGSRKERFTGNAPKGI